MEVEGTATDARSIGRAQAEYYKHLINEESRGDVEILLEVMNLLGMTPVADRVFNHLAAVRSFHPRALRRNMAREYLTTTIRHWAAGSLDMWISHLHSKSRGR